MSVFEVNKECPKYFREIGASMIDNHLIIRMEKSKKSKKKNEDWSPPCDCEMVEIRRPSGKEGPKIINGGDANQILFQIQSKSNIYGKDDPNTKSQAIAYKVGACRGGKDTNDSCRVITIDPQLGGSGSQQVHSDHVTDGDHDVYLLRIKKTRNTPEQSNRNVEVELRTPKPPPPQPEPVISSPEPAIEPDKNTNDENPVEIVKAAKKSKKINKSKKKKKKQLKH